MFKFIKKFFKEPETEEILLSELNAWLKNESATLPIGTTIKEYYSKIQRKSIPTKTLEIWQKRWNPNLILKL